MIVGSLGQMPRMVRAIGWGGIVRALNLFSVLAENHPKEPHLYLQVLGVDPPFQGKHYGSALLDRLKMRRGRVAVEINQAVIPRAQYDAVKLKPGYTVEVINFVGGG